MVLLATAGVVLGGAAAAETRSWSGRVESPAEAIPKRPAPAQPATPGPQGKILKTGPNTPGERPAIAPPAGTQAPFETQLKPSLPATASAAGASEYAKAQPTGEDAAYEAFDQGKYLTALDLAQKAAEKGDPQAHTLVGRIYA